MKSEVESTYDRLREQGYTEEQIEAIIGLGALGDEKDSTLQRQFAYANELRNQPGPQGRHVGNGRIFVAQNPLEDVANVMQHYGGEKINRDALSRESEIRDEQMRRRMEYLKRKRNNEAVTTPANIPGAAPGQILV